MKKNILDAKVNRLNRTYHMTERKFEWLYDGNYRLVLRHRDTSVTNVSPAVSNIDKLADIVDTLSDAKALENSGLFIN